MAEQTYRMFDPRDPSKPAEHRTEAEILATAAAFGSVSIIVEPSKAAPERWSMDDLDA